jgi:aldehyde:ferredoxin oxidoreductase
LEKETDMGFGYSGKILRINLTDRSTQIEEPEEVFYRKYLGGEGFVAHTLLKEVGPGVDPLGPENVLIFAAGMLTGAPVGGSGRQSVGARSPLTGGFGESEAGGFWGAELKQAGFDAIIILGASEKPVYLWINRGSVEIRDASGLVGKTTAKVQQLIREELGDKRIRVAQVGPAGERLVRYACVIFDVNRAAGRTGMGAVMGSKNLKAIAVRGVQRVALAHAEIVRESAKWLSENLEGLVGRRKAYGTAGCLLPQQYTNSLPTYNFQAGEFAGAEKISGERMAETILVDRDNCYACPIYCKRVVEVDDEIKVDRAYGGPEFETIGAFGSMCGVSDLKAISKANELCNAYGLDTISTGVTISFAMECFEKGILTLADTGGIELRFGNAAASLEMIQQINDRTGLGKLLGEGSYRAAQVIGKGSEEFVMHVKGQEIPQQEPRAHHGLGLGYAVSPTGADHVHNIYDQSYTDADLPKMKSVAALGILEPLPYNTLNPAKVRLFRFEVNWMHMVNCIGLCIFLPYDYDRVRDILHGITGWNVTIWELMHVGERVLNLARMFNARQGLGIDKDILPRRFSDPLKSKTVPLEGIAQQELQQGVETYYAMMGWDPVTGAPLRSKLQELDIEWAA